MDETGKPLYGDVFGTNAVDFQVNRMRSQSVSFFITYVDQFQLSFSVP